MKMYFIFDHIYTASYIVQQRIFGRFAREIWGFRVLQATLGIVAFFMMAWLKCYISNLFIVIVCPIMVCFSPLIHYYIKNKNNDFDQLLDKFKNLPRSIQSVFVGYIVLLFVVVPMFAIGLIILNILGYL